MAEGQLHKGQAIPPQNTIEETIEVQDSNNTREEPSNNTVRNIDEEIAEAERERTTLQKQQKLQTICKEIRRMKAGDDLAFAPQSRQDTPGTNDPMSDVVVGSKRPAVEPLIPRSTSKRRIRPKELPLYYGKSVKEHLNWTRDARTTFWSYWEDFPTEEDKILYAMPYLAGEPKETWYRHERNIDISLPIYGWDYFEKFLLDIVEDPVNRQLDAAQQFTNATQRPQQSVYSFEAYLSSLEAQLPPFSPAHLVSNLFTKLQPDLCKALTNYQDLPKTRDGLLALAARLEHNLLGGKPGAGKQHGDSRKSSKQKQKTSMPFRSTATDSTDTAEIKAKSKGQDHAKPGKKPGGGQDKSHITCYNCDKKGHYANECTLPSKNPNTVLVIAVSTSKNGRVLMPAPHRREQNKV